MLSKPDFSFRFKSEQTDADVSDLWATLLICDFQLNAHAVVLVITDV